MKFGSIYRKGRMRRRLFKRIARRLGRGKGLGRELMLEIGVALFATGLIVALIVLLAGRGVGIARQSSREVENPPSSDSVPSERHRNLATVAAR